MQPKSTIMDLPVYQPGKPIEEVKRELGLEEVIKLASNENPYGCSELAKQAAMAELEANSFLYPDGASQELVQALAEFYQVRPEQILIGAGSDEIIALMTRAYLVPGDETIMATPSFPQYKHNAQIEGAVCIEVPLVNGTHDLEVMAARITEKTKIIWVCNPNNPSGTIVTRQQLEDFLAKVPDHVLVALDEAYFEYVEDEAYPDGLDYIDRPNVIVLRTFSKAYGLAALRIGYAVGDPQVIRAINQVRGPFNTTRASQAAARAALQDQDFIASCRERNRAGIEYLSQEFERLGLSYYPAYGNFILVDCRRDAKQLFEALLHKGVIVRGGHALGFPTSLRVTVGSMEDNEKFIRALEEVLAER